MRQNAVGSGEGLRPFNSLTFLAQSSIRGIKKTIYTKQIDVNKTTILTRSVTIRNKLGMHARPAAMISKLAQKAEKGVWIGIGDTRAEASSIIDILSIGCRQGSEVSVTVESEADLPILESISELIESGFGEDKE